MPKHPPAMTPWLSAAREARASGNAAALSLYRSRAHRCLTGLKALREAEMGLFARVGVK